MYRPYQGRALPLSYERVSQCLERAARIELATSAWKAETLPLCNARTFLVGRAGFEPAYRIAEQIYSLPPLTTRPPTHAGPGQPPSIMGPPVPVLVAKPLLVRLLGPLCGRIDHLANFGDLRGGEAADLRLAFDEQFV